MIPYRWYPIVVGGAAGIALAALTSIASWVAFALTGITDDLTGPVLIGVLVGLLGGGYTAGRLGDRSLYQGGMAGLSVAAAVVAISLVGGSPARPWQLIIVFVLGLVFGVAGGALAVRSRRSYAEGVSSPDDRGLRPEESPDSTGQDAG